MNHTVGYLSAAPRVSTKPDAEESGARAHILGVMGAFETLGWNVQKFIVGDQIDPKITKNSKQLVNGKLKTLSVDIARLVMGLVNANKASQQLPKVDWVYERFAVLQSLGWKFKKRGVPWILETNGLIFSEAKSDRKSLFLVGLAKKLEIQAYHRCDVLICVSETLKETIVRETKVNPEKILVIPNGVDVTYFDPAKYPKPSPRQHPTIGFVGSLYPWQGLNYLIQAIDELRSENIFFNLQVVGDGMKFDEWKTECETRNLQDQVEFVGRVSFDEIPKKIASFDIGFSGQVPLKKAKMYHSPLKIYEYMAMGKPIIATAFQDARKLVEAKGTGFLFEPGNIESLKNALREAYKYKEELAEMGTLARKEIVENHSWESRVKDMIAQIDRMVK